MSIATVVTRGFGSFGSIAEVVTRGYSIGAALALVVGTPIIITLQQAGIDIDAGISIAGISLDSPINITVSFDDIIIDA